MDALPGGETVLMGHRLQSAAPSSEFQVLVGQFWHVLFAHGFVAFGGVPGEKVPALHGAQMALSR